MAPGDGINTSSDPALILHFVCAAMTHCFTGPVQTVQTDDGPEFKGRFAQQVLQYYVRHRIARPYKKKAQPTGRVSTGPCGRNAWGGPPIGWKSSRPLPPRCGPLPLSLPASLAHPDATALNRTLCSRGGTIGYLRRIVRCTVCQTYSRA